jgi:hypothetical protein
MSSKGWFISFIIIAITITISIATFNYFIDPYGFFKNKLIIIENQQKEGVRNNIRYVKSIEIALRKPETIIMGSSRVHDGINPQALPENVARPIYNYGLDMARIEEISLYLDHALLNTDVKNLIIGLDFFMFNKHQQKNINYDNIPINKKISSLDLYSKPLLSTAALLSSLDTIKASRSQPNRKEFLPNGFRPGSQVFFGVKDYKKLHNYTNWIFLSSRQQQTFYYAKMDVDRKSYAVFQTILETCHIHKLTCKLYISPAHAKLDGEGLIAAKKYGEFENWKRNITAIAESENIELYDFSGYNHITTEPVKTPMLNYWDSSHFTEIIGQLVIDRLYGLEPPSPDGFGIKLTSKNIEQHLYKNRISRDSYRKKNKTELDQLHKMYLEALSGRRQPRELTDGIF